MNILQNNLNNVEWNNIYNNNNAQDAYTKFSKILQEKVNEYLPIQKVVIKKKNHKPWVTTSLLVSIKRKNRLYSKYCLSPTPLNESSYKTYRNKLNHLLRISEKRFIQNRIRENKNNISETWKIVKELIGKSKQKRKQDSFNDAGVIITNPDDISNKFNDFFINIGPKLAEKIASKSQATDFLKTVHTNNFFLLPTSEDEVKTIIS